MRFRGALLVAPAVPRPATIRDVWIPPDRGRLDAKLGIVLFALLLSGPVWLILVHAGSGPGADRIDALEHVYPDRDWRCIVDAIAGFGLPGTGGSWDIQTEGASSDFRVVTPLFSYRVSVGDGHLVYRWATGTVIRSMDCSG